MWDADSYKHFAPTELGFGLYETAKRGYLASEVALHRLAPLS